MKIKIIVLSVMILCLAKKEVRGQHHLLHPKTEIFTKDDTLRGSLNEDRTWWDITYYDLHIQPDYLTKSIEGTMKISFKVLRQGARMQIDLQEPMIIDRALLDGKTVECSKGGKNVWFVKTEPLVTKDKINKEMILEMNYHGIPKEAKMAPWDGGWIWSKDEKGRPWMSVACQGLGASVWYPCKDHQSDEPDHGARLSITVPDTLVAVGNGRLKSVQQIGNQKTYIWEVKNPINNYLLVPSIGAYVNFEQSTFDGEKGKLDLSFWALDYHVEQAKKQFQQAKLMLKAFEYWMGPYPFYEDSYKLVEAPHLGMENQSNVAYGNHFENGYKGNDLSHTGWGLKWDFIIVHESAHEWFANNITSKDIADMWVHESFGNYAETLFTEYYYGIEAGNDYNFGIRQNIYNDRPIIGPFGVNREGSGDMYYKGGNMLHTIRHSMDNDELFRSILRGLGQTFYHKTVDGTQIEAYISKMAGFNYQKIFDQYLRTTQIPCLQYILNKKTGRTFARWINCVDGFNLPIAICGQNKKLNITTKWQHFELTPRQMAWMTEKNILRQYYITVSDLTGKKNTL